MGQGIQGARPQQRPQAQPVDFATARALIADGNITKEDAAAIGEGVRQNKISGDQLGRLQGEASRYVRANRNTQGAMPFGSGTMLADNRQVDMGVADLQGLRSATPAAPPNAASGPQRQGGVAPAAPDLAERGRQMIDRDVTTRLGALPFKALRDAIPADQKTPDGGLRRDSPFYDAIQYSGSDQFRRLAQAFESVGNQQMASFSGQEASRLERAETMRRDVELRQATAPRPGEASGAQGPAQPREVRASELRGRNDLTADEPRMGFNKFQVRVGDGEGRSTTVSIVNTGSLSADQLKSQAVELARAGKNSNLQ